jgi:O-antigen/teichoic acid export membrane protein
VKKRKARKYFASQLLNIDHHIVGRRPMLTAARSKLKTLKSHQGFRRYAANTSWMMGEKILRMFVGLFVGIWVARYLGPEQFGLLSYAQSFVFLFTAIATLGLDGIVVRELVKDESRRDELLGTAFGLKLIGAILILPSLWLAVQLTSNDAHTNLLVFIIASATIFQSFNVIDFYYQSKVQSKYVAWANSLTLGLSSAIKIALILNEAPLTVFAAMVAFDAIVLAAGLVFFYKVSSQKKLFNWSFKGSIAKNLLIDSWPLILSGLVVSVYMKIDQVMIKQMLDTEAVGQYAAAVRLTEVWYFIPMEIANTLYPAIESAKKISEEHYLNRMQKLYDVLAWMAILLAVVVYFLSESIISVLYGNQYLEAAPVLGLYFWSAIFVFIGVASSKWFVTENLQIFSFYRTLAGVITNIALNLWLIPVYGIWGAALATLISQVIASYLFNCINPKVRIVFIQQTKALIAPIRYFRMKRA